MAKIGHIRQWVTHSKRMRTSFFHANEPDAINDSITGLSARRVSTDVDWERTTEYTNKQCSMNIAVANDVNFLPWVREAVKVMKFHFDGNSHHANIKCCEDYILRRNCWVSLKRFRQCRVYELYLATFLCSE
jgi:hypothetical protein